MNVEKSHKEEVCNSLLRRDHNIGVSIWSIENILNSKEKYKITKDVPGAGANGGLGTLIQKDGNLYRLKDEIKPDPKGKDKLYLNLEPIGDSATQLGLKGFKERAGLQQP